MNKINIKIGVFAVAVSLGALTSCEQENDLLIDEQVAASKEIKLNESLAKGTCNTGVYSPIDAISGTDFNDAINTKVDDRSCSYDYTQSGSYGLYRLNSSNNNNSGSTLQVRMERTTPTKNYSNNGFVSISGKVKILNAGNSNSSRATYKPNDMRDDNGTYIAQVKGKHDKMVAGRSPDPAIMLFVAKPKRRNRSGVTEGGSVIKDSQGNIKQFKIYAEVIKKRGGSGTSGRRLIYITTVNRNTDFNFSVTSRFKTENNTKNHYIDYNINGKTNTIKLSRQNTIGETTNATNTKIRMGAYRCKGGQADIRWKKDLTRSGV